MMKVFSVFVLLLAACGNDATPVARGEDEQQGVRVAGQYDVPVTADLAPAATYATKDIRWRVTGGEARLDYDLPSGIVGRPINVDFRGPFDGKKGTLAGPAGTAECTVAGASVVCNETMRGLLPLAVDLEAVRATAAADAVSVQDRIKVAEQFAADPIGIVRFDLGN